MKHNSATTIKCKFSNLVHKALEPNINIKKTQRYRVAKKVLTDKEKLALLEEIMKIHAECSEELTACLYKRREKKRTQKLRAERGYVAKKKTPIAAHEAQVAQ